MYVWTDFFHNSLNMRKDFYINFNNIFETFDAKVSIFGS